jgi:prepilin-type N-terminal cleavage/methylation domain-containing protein
MKTHPSIHRAGFTLVEIMIVVAIIALLAAIAVPNFQRARKRSQATRILEDLRVLDYALARYAIETNRSAGDSVVFSDLQQYLKTTTPLYHTGRDLLGNEYGPNFTVDIFPAIPPAAYAYLSDVAPPEFWSPYR